jgi:hypothetical protein
MTGQGISIPPDVADLRIRKLEAKYDLLQYKVDGWCVWPVLRFGVSMALQNIPLSQTASLENWQLFPIAMGDIVRLIAPRKARYFVVTLSSSRSEQIDGRYKDIYFDDLLSNVGSYFKIEKLNSPSFWPRNKTALIQSNLTSTAFRILVVLLRKVGRRVDPIINIANNLSACLRQELELVAFTPNQIAKSLLSFYWSKKLYTWLLRRVRPAYVFSVDGYGEHSIMAAAKELGIQVIEFQHGFLDRHHSGYSWTSYALPYKARMPIPNQIFLYGEHWQQELAINGFWQNELHSVGSLRLDQYRQNTNKSENGECTLVLTTQGIDVEKVIGFIADFLKLAEGRLPLRLNIKLHPGYEANKEVYEVAFQNDKRVRVILGSEQPSTFQLLTKTHFHLSISSTCHYEALGLGVPTIILPFATHEIILPLYQAGHAFLAQTPQNLLDIIFQWRNCTVPIELSTFYFEPGALENMKSVLSG